MANYASIVASSNPYFAAGGYKNVFLFARRDDFLSLKKPTAAGIVLGDATEINTAHTFTLPKGFVSWASKTNSVTLKGSTVGDDGSKEIEWAATFVILGDSASTQEQVQRQLNDDLVILLKEAACLTNDSYVQLGDECVSPTVTAEFDGKTTKEGKKEYTITVTCKKKFFYNAAVVFAGAGDEEE